MSRARRLPLAEGKALADEVVALLDDATDRIMVAGSIRRGQADVGDVEIVCLPRYAASYRQVDMFSGVTERVDLLYARCAELLEQGVFAHRPDKNGQLHRRIVEAAAVELFDALDQGALLGERLVRVAAPPDLPDDFLVGQRDVGLRTLDAQERVDRTDEGDADPRIGLPMGRVLAVGALLQAQVDVASVALLQPMHRLGDGQPQGGAHFPPLGSVLGGGIGWPAHQGNAPFPVEQAGGPGVQQLFFVRLDVAVRVGTGAEPLVDPATDAVGSQRVVERSMGHPQAAGHVADGQATHFVQLTNCALWNFHGPLKNGSYVSPQYLTDARYWKLIDWTRSGIAFGRKFKRLTYRGFAVDVFSAGEQNWGVILLLRTGPSTWNQRLVLRQSQGGWLPRGLFFRDGHLWKLPPPFDASLVEHAVVVPTPEEADVFRALQMDWIAPEKRDAYVTERAATSARR